MDKRRLGRGLDALLSQGEAADAPAAAQAEVAVDRLQRNPFQPRKAFDVEELATLTASIKSHGVLQPLVVRPAGDGFQVVAGERRLRAAQEAGLATVPVRIVEFDDQQTLEATLSENIHRTDLNPIEKAQGFKDYLDRFGMNHEQLAGRLGLARSTITNLVNLLELAPEVQEAVRLGQVSEGHAKVLKGIKDAGRQVALCRQIVAQGLSVKAADALVRQQRAEADQAAAEEAPRAAPVEKTAHVRSIEDELRQKLSTKVQIRLKDKERGAIVLPFESNDDFLRLLECLRR